MTMYYNIVLYTNSARPYTEYIINQIGRQFFTEIITRPLEKPVPLKSISRIKSATTENFVIIDDRIDIWETFSQNYVYEIPFFSVVTKNMDDDIELKKYSELLICADQLANLHAI